ncbi:hypothetical protein ACK30Y_05165 [Aeromonas caviae]
MIDLLQFKIGTMNGSEFERFVRRLLPKTSYKFKNIKATYNYKGKETKGPVDLFSYKEETKTYAAVICTTQSEGVRGKITSDIDNLASEKCHIRNDIDEVFICVANVVRTEEIEYREKCLEHGWRAEIHSLDSLVYLTNEHPDIVDDLCAKEIQGIINRYNGHNTMKREINFSQEDIDKAQRVRMYDCGNRIYEIRNELGISSSRFIELVDFNSEKELLIIESLAKEASSILTDEISKRTGVARRWIRHGEGNKYEIDYISTWGFDKLDVIKSWNPKSLYFLINKKTMSLVLLAHIHDLNWKIFGFSFSLDFWNWWGDEKYIPEIFDLLNRFSKEFAQCPYGRILEEHEYNEILSGGIHPSIFLKRTNKFSVNWFDDLQDIHHKYPISSSYEDWYGEWFVKIQSYFRKYDKLK